MQKPQGTDGDICPSRHGQRTRTRTHRQGCAVAGKRHHKPKGIFMNNVAPFMKSQGITLATLAANWLDAKAEEAASIARRREIEELIVAAMPKKDEGSVSESVGNFKLTATYKLNRTVDAESLQKLWGDLPELVKDAFKWKPDLVLSHARALETANPAAYAQLAQFVTTSPARAAVKIEQSKEVA